LRTSPDSLNLSSVFFAVLSVLELFDKNRVVQISGAVLLVLSATGCRQDMHDQPKYRPLDDTLLYTGKVDGSDALMFPFRIDDSVMARGQQRFNIYCSPCHGRTGMGDGMVVRRGYRRPPSFADERLRQAPVGHFFDVMTNGFGAMPDYAAQIRPADRWAIAAYIRALQLSAHATLADVPVAEREQLNR
jgi:mono/diheme cytochrome c family protein